MSDMRLTNIVTKWFEDQEWEERPDINEDENTSSSQFTYSTGDYSIVCFLDVNEKLGFFTIFSYYFDIKVPEKKIDEIKQLLALLNDGRFSMGSLYYREDHRIVYYKQAMDFENATFEPQHISNMLDAASAIMKLTIPKVLSICFSEKSAEQVVDESGD